MTPSEAATLQGIPRSFKFLANDKATYKQLGNGVNVGVVKHVAEKLFAHCKWTTGRLVKVPR